MSALPRPAPAIPPAGRAARRRIRSRWLVAGGAALTLGLGWLAWHPARGLPAARPASPAAGLDRADLDPAGIPSRWVAEVQSAIARSEYEPKTSAPGFSAPNRAQHFRVHFRPGAVELGPRRTNGEGRWQFSWQTIHCGREAGEHVPVATRHVLPELRGSRIEYAHDGFVEWYENTAAGLEQGFTIERRPPGERELVIQGAIGGGLRAESRADGAVDFHDERGCVLHYGALHVWDAAGRELPARLEVAAAGDRVSMHVVDDLSTRYPVTVDPLITQPVWSHEANQLFAHLGESVATAGDVNRDGYSDILVGAPMYDNGNDLEGRALLFLGSATGPGLSPAWIGESNVTDARFGIAVAAAGDVNGDGFDDVIIGAYAFSNGQTSEGRAYVFHGSAGGMSATPAWTFESNQVGAFLGRAVASAGDVNADGFADVIIGAYALSNGQTGEGRAYVFHGSAAGLALAPAWIGESDVAGAKYGCSVATAGDVNGDGYADVVIGAEDLTNGQANEGRAYLHRGSAAGITAGAPSWIVESNVAAARFGRSVATAGDVNGDGYADLIIGASLLTNGQSSEGRVYVYHGSASGPGPTADWTRESNLVNAQFGHAVATAGDVNGDGYADVVIGAPKFSGGETNEGRIYVYEGSMSGLGILPSNSIDSNRAGTELGFSAGTAGDVNGDGYSDVIAGANVYDNGQGDEGAAFVYLGAGAAPSTNAGWFAEGNQADAYFGWVGGAGDVNGDGYSDVVVGAEDYDNGEAEEGRAYAFYGSAAGLPMTPSWVVESNREATYFGAWPGTAGDVNGDGFSDVVIAARYFSPQTRPVRTGASKRHFATPLSAAGGPEGIPGDGKVYVFHGSPTGLATTPAWTAQTDQTQSMFGLPARAAGDVNGDGYGDLLIGAGLYDHGEDNEGKAFLYEGSPSGLQLTPAWTVEGNAPGIGLGLGLGPAGDVNGDGYSDVLIGLPYHSNGQTFEGEARLYQGSASGLQSSPAWQIESDRAQSLFGFVLNAAGDVNGDGFSDVLAGSQFFSDPEHWEGKVFEYDGSALGISTTPSWSVESNQIDRVFASVAGTAGDVNGDGYSDILVNDLGFDAPLAGQSADEGQVLVYGGSSAGLSVNPIFDVAFGQPSAAFGYRVDLAGDVNGDGFSDIIVGALLYDNDQENEGRAFLYYGNAGDGLDRVPRQRRSDNTGPIDLLGASNSTNSFRLDVLGRTPAGRGKVRLQVEVKPLGVAFNGAGLVTGAVTDTGVPGAAGSVVPLSAVPSGLAPGTDYHWRLRLASAAPFFPHSRWFSPAMNAPTETDFRTRAAIGIPAPEAAPPTIARIEHVAPNPFRSMTEIAYSLPAGGRHRLLVYDVTGREVAVLADAIGARARHVVRWAGEDAAGRRLPAGVYFMALEVAGRHSAEKITLLP